MRLVQERTRSRHGHHEQLKHLAGVAESTQPRQDGRDALHLAAVPVATGKPCGAAVTVSVATCGHSHAGGERLRRCEALLHPKGVYVTVIIVGSQGVQGG